MKTNKESQPDKPVIPKPDIAEAKCDFMKGMVL